MKKLGQLVFALALVTVGILGVLALSSTPADAQFQTTCPSSTCGSTSGWTLYGNCQVYDAATDCLYSCKEYRHPTTGSRCKKNCIPL